MPEPFTTAAISLRRSAILSIAALAALAACEQDPGSVEGDGYLVLELGHERSLADLDVRLVRELPKVAELDSVLGRACPTRTDSTADRLRAPERWERAWDERERILTGLTTHATTADARARFRIDSIPPGRYRLWADTTLGDTRWTWLVPVRVGAGQTARVNLTNGNPDENPFRCR